MSGFVFVSLIFSHRFQNTTAQPIGTEKQKFTKRSTAFRSVVEDMESLAQSNKNTDLDVLKQIIVHVDRPNKRDQKISFTIVWYLIYFDAFRLEIHLSCDVEFCL
jgi:hypothetical protein